MSRDQRRGKQEKGSDVAEKVVVAVKASKEIPKTALVWALTHVVQPGDCITLLVVVPSQSSGKKLWGFPRFAGDCANGNRKSLLGTISEQKIDIRDSCSQMIVQLRDVYDPNKVNVDIKIVYGSPCGSVAVEAKNAQASWVVLDKHLKPEEKRCMEELQCNIVVMKRSQPKVLRLNLNGLPKEPESACHLPSELDEASQKHPRKKDDCLNPVRVPVGTPTSSPELGTPFTATEAGTSSVSNSDPGTSPLFISEINGVLKKEESFRAKGNQDIDDATSDSDSENLSTSSASLRFQPWISDFLISQSHSTHYVEESSHKSSDRPQASSTKALLGKFQKSDRDAGVGMLNYIGNGDFSGNVREAVSLSRNAPPGPPPLCSICQHKAPVFGKPPRFFSYAELELATGGFSQANFLAEGGYGSVHRGVLPDGQAVAVKQHKLASSQGDHEFCSEVEVLSCAQHRNVVMLIGFCIEDRRRLLVYEYICNGSLDSHLYGQHRQPLEWSARQKVAVGAARGLRYLHEECRVGCIVHRDMRPNNILITHDFEPLVGDFGLARWQPDGDTGVETRVIGTFGYLAPEYAQSGQITEKADVYSFGVVLVELVTGRKAVDLNRPKGQQCLTEWARPLLEDYAIDELIDPRLGNQFSEQEVYCMLHAASLCIRRDPQSRPRMSQVLRVLEGDMVMDSNSNFMSTQGYDVGSQSGRMCWSDQQHQQYSGSLAAEPLEEFSGKLSLENLRPAFWERVKARASCEDL
ncbi:inactive protein kinase SELMODRAFT_444075-like [Humulus lupulus]|uniref:inactive protein kinase SELMODRAFT_444075-like n=1 Tax=Humulus lupulus TaxID=3486 RepID=UPI002B417B9B|nr:inactive protein kinase SELMODRAFT_444075-like [Humulus lupulus]XP_062087660.1 inactive protein kinase SELMODRAFT_444075-like [Humulus lupulus]XP_062087661.1 inactive protein kinase SELMODRAFT_444075-like [Humulus lupulus]XP_062087662.1 inactive protein kinase SELMODRAFT_444075-like [Humulus lupulus]XP_062087663.1 inactive protein kinase SELMODRAFT_444075-like [Humulus lupulus]